MNIVEKNILKYIILFEKFFYIDFAIPPTIFSATLSWTSSTPLSRLPCRRTGRAAASASWTSAENTASTSSA